MIRKGIFKNMISMIIEIRSGRVDTSLMSDYFKV